MKLYELNLGAESFDVLELLGKADNSMLEIYTANESLVPQAMYIRNGMAWSTWARNMHLLANSGKVKELHNVCTVNALCLESLTEFLSYLLKFKEQYGKDFPSFSLEIVHFPEFQSPMILSDKIRTLHKEKLQLWYDSNVNNRLLHEHELSQIQTLLSYLDVVKTPQINMPNLQNKFKQFYTQYDQHCGKNFIETFPSMKDWYSEL